MNVQASAAAVVEQHPNATVAIVSTGPATLIVWALGQFVTVPAEVGAAFAGLLISTALLFGCYIRMAGSAIARYGIVGCWRRLIYGAPA